MKNATLTAIAAATLALAACSSRTGDSAVPSAAPVDIADDRLGLEIGIQTLRLETLDMRNECARRSGFPQLMHAQAMRPNEASAHRGMTFWNPLESGPVTRDIAAQFGFVGVTTIFEESVPAEVVGDDPEFDAVVAACEAQVDDAAGSDISERFAAWTDFTNTVRRDFMNIVEPAAAEVLAEQRTCFADRTGADVDGDFDDVLDEIGIEIGEYVDLEADVAVYDLIEVIEQPRSVYQPTEAEIDLAQTFADCADDTDFVNRLLEVQKGPRAEILESHGDTIAEFADWSNQTVEALRDFEPSAVSP